MLNRYNTFHTGRATESVMYRESNGVDNEGRARFALALTTAREEARDYYIYIYKYIDTEETL